MKLIINTLHTLSQQQSTPTDTLQQHVNRKDYSQERTPPEKPTGKIPCSWNNQPIQERINNGTAIGGRGWGGERCHYGEICGG